MRLGQFHDMRQKSKPGVRNASFGFQGLPDKEAVATKNDTLFLSSDMQKVILLPRLPGYKVSLFTNSLLIINQSFAPISKEEVSKNKALGTLWHEEIRGRKDGDVTSAFIQALEYAEFRGSKNYVIWLDNCASQNKN